MEDWLLILFLMDIVPVYVTVRTRCKHSVRYRRMPIKKGQFTNARALRLERDEFFSIDPLIPYLNLAFSITDGKLVFIVRVVGDMLDLSSTVVEGENVLIIPVVEIPHVNILVK